jgi:hypothetical protein
MVRRAGPLRLAGAALAAAVLLGGWLGLGVLDLRHDAEHPLVVIARDGVKLRTGNGLSYLARDDRPLSRGVEARWLYTRGDWYQVELADGRVGWVHRGEVLRDDPAEPGRGNMARTASVR